MSVLDIAKSVLSEESVALAKMSEALDESFELAVNIIHKSRARVVVCGMGKSGHVGRKISATFNSTGTKSLFLHPAEAVHGDLGCIESGDVLLCLSNSGETAELVRLLPYFSSNKNPVISITGNPKSTLAVASDVSLIASIDREACPLNLAPTTSTTLALALGDAIAAGLMGLQNFKPESFARYHPAGSLGRKLLGKVRDFAVPARVITHDTGFANALEALASSRVGLVVVSNASEIGVITDGDVRRLFDRVPLSDLASVEASEVASWSPVIVDGEVKCGDADSLMARKAVNSLLVSIDDGKFMVYQNMNRS